MGERGRGIRFVGNDAYAWGNVVAGGQLGIAAYRERPRLVYNQLVARPTAIPACWPSEYTTAAVLNRNTVSRCANGVSVRSYSESTGGALVRLNEVSGNSPSGSANGLFISRRAGDRRAQHGQRRRYRHLESAGRDEDSVQRCARQQPLRHLCRARNCRWRRQYRLCQRGRHEPAVRERPVRLAVASGPAYSQPIVAPERAAARPPPLPCPSGGLSAPRTFGPLSGHGVTEPERGFRSKNGSGRRASNPRPSAWEALRNTVARVLQGASMRIERC